MADGLHDALENVDLIFADSHEQGQRRAHVERAGEKAAQGDGSRKRSSRVFDFVAHDGGELEANKAKTDDTEGVQNEARVRWNPEVRRSQGSAEAQPDNDTQGNQQDTGDKGAEAADVVDPFANAKADDVEDYENDEQCERS